MTNERPDSLKGVFFIFGGPESKNFFSSEVSPSPKDSKNIKHLGSVVDSFGDMAVHRQTDRHTDRHCQILSPLALWAGGEKILQLPFPEEQSFIKYKFIIELSQEITILHISWQI